MSAAVQFETGNLDSVAIQQVPIPPLHSNHVLIRVENSPVHSEDIDLLKDTSKKAAKVGGVEGSGTVIKSSGVLSNLRLEGKRVCFWQSEKELGGSWAEFVVCDVRTVMPLHSEVDFIRGSTMMLAPLTIMMISQQISKGNHKVIVNRFGNHLLGKYILRWCNFSGISGIHIVRNQDEKEIFISGAGKYSVDCSKPEFEKDFTELCKQLKPTCAFDACGGEISNLIFSNLLPNSQMFFYGNSKALVPDISFQDLVFHNKKIQGLNLKEWFFKQNKVSRFKTLHKIQELHWVFQGEVAAIMPFANLEESLELAKGDHINGKIILQVAEGRQRNSQGAILDYKKVFKGEEKDKLEKMIQEYTTPEAKLQLSNLGPLSPEITGADMVLTQLENSSVYRGEVVQGRPKGWGECYYPNGSLYIGCWHYGKFHGKGRLVTSEGECYEGLWDNSKFVIGKLIKQSGEVQEGEFENYKITKGKETTSQEVYEGTFLEGVRHGKGILKFSDKVYEGEFRENQLKGKGVLKYEEGKVFEGEFEGSKALGKMKYKNGEVFEGKLVDWLEEGEGVFVESSGAKKNGVWHKGKVQTWYVEMEEADDLAPQVLEVKSPEEAKVVVEPDLAQEEDLELEVKIEKST